MNIIEDGAKIAKNVKIGNFCIVKKGAEIEEGTIIADFCYIDSEVKIGKNNHIGTNVHLKGKVIIGNGNHILDNTVIGLPSKHIGYHFYQGRVIIGNDNFIGNNCSIDCGNNYLSCKKTRLLPFLAVDLDADTDLEDATIIGNRCYILNNVSIHHNCRIGLGDLPDSKQEYDTIICCGCCLNGFVQLRKGCEISSGNFIREFASIGEGCFTAMSEHIVKDVQPFSYILKNKNKGYATKLMEKFEYSENDVETLRKNFSTKRSGSLKLYD